MDMSKPSINAPAIFSAANLFQPPVHTPVVYYDVNCALCRNLAAFMEKNSASDQIIFKPNSSLEVPHNPKKLLVEIESDGQLQRFYDQDAWQWLLQNHPSFKELNWIAEKIGITKLTTSVIASTASLLRRMCFRCPR